MPVAVVRVGPSLSEPQAIAVHGAGLVGVVGDVVPVVVVVVQLVASVARDNLPDRRPLAARRRECNLRFDGQQRVARTGPIRASDAMSGRMPSGGTW